MISSIEFCRRYTDFLEIIDHVIKPEYYPAIRKMYETDPHDLVTPTGCFTCESAVIGFIFSVMLNTHKKLSKEFASAASR